MDADLQRTLRGALAGATAAGVWAAQQPLDKLVFGSRYDDLELLGKAVTRGRAWPAVGLGLHTLNGATFGALYSLAARHAVVSAPPAVHGACAALAEHVAFWPAGRLSDRLHPARNELPRLSGNRRAFWQSAWRHLLFGVLLGELEARLNAPEAAADEPEPAFTASSNGHGSLEHAALGQAAS
jgi:hypothetical protein